MSKKIILTEGLAVKCNYKSLRNLKTSISRRLGKEAYNADTLEIEVSKLIAVVAKKASLEVIEELINSLSSHSFATPNADITISFNVKESITENIKSSIKIGGFVMALCGNEINKEELVNKAINDTKEKFKKRQELLEKRIEEYKKDESQISEVNHMLESIGSNLRIRQFIKIDKDICLYGTTYLTGNGFFKRIDARDIVIPKLDYCSEEYYFKDNQDRKDFFKDLEVNKIYECTEFGETAIDIENVHDDINYEVDYKNICFQLLKKKQLKASADFQNYIDFRSEDEKIDFDLKDEDIVNIVMASQGQELYYPWDNRYDFSLEKAEQLLQQLKDKNYKKVIDDANFNVS